MKRVHELPSPTEFADLVRRADTDADHRLPLLEQAAPALYGACVLSESESAALADRFERWCYQLLNNRRGQPSADDQALIEVLNLATNRLRGNPPRPPRSPRAALVSGQLRDSEVESCLDTARPLEAVMRRAAELTALHFGASALPPGRWTIKLYAPLYLSSYCVNHCRYCFFRYPEQLEREHLDTAAALAQADILQRHGFRHVLLVAGDFPKLTTTDYFAEIAQALTGRGFRVAIEIAAQSTLSYARLARAGVCGVTLYQETYQEDRYASYHRLGPKTWFDWRLEAPERAAEAGMRRLGLGILLGLADPRLDVRSLVRHGRYLRERFPGVALAFSLPRIHEAPEGFAPAFAVDDETFIRLYCALRIAFPQADLVLSTREQLELRDRLAAICVTQMSAGSRTSPGGYGALEESAHRGQQFPVADERPVEGVAQALRRAGFGIAWDWPDDQGMR